MSFLFVRCRKALTLTQGRRPNVELDWRIACLHSRTAGSELGSQSGRETVSRRWRGFGPEADRLVSLRPRPENVRKALGFGILGGDDADWTGQQPDHQLLGGGPVTTAGRPTVHKLASWCTGCGRGPWVPRALPEVGRTDGATFLRNHATTHPSEPIDTALICATTPIAAQPSFLSANPF